MERRTGKIRGAFSKMHSVALRNLELLIKTGWNVFVRFVAENAGRG